MDTMTKSPPDVTGTPFVFTGYEIEACYDRRGKFRLGELRRQQNEKGLQIILSGYHGITTRYPDEVYHFVDPLHFSMIKARRTHLGYYRMAIVYRFQGVTWRHVFRFERSSRGGLSGTLYFNSRRIIAK